MEIFFWWYVFVCLFIFLMNQCYLLDRDKENIHIYYLLYVIMLEALTLIAGQNTLKSSLIMLWEKSNATAMYVFRPLKTQVN